MTSIAIIAGVSAFIFCLGALSFLMMFQDVTPSQNSYAWPYLLPVGIIGLAASGIGFLFQVFA